MTTTARAKNGPAFGRQRLPERFCNLDRLLADMEARELDGLVVTSALNVFYLTGFNGVAHKADEPRPYTLVLARREPEHPILVLADYYLTTPLYQPTWVKDIRPCRSVMSPVDLPPRKEDIDAHIPRSAAGIEWVERARAAYRFESGEQIRAAMRDLGIDRGRVGFDDEGFGRRLARPDVEVANGYDPLMHARAVKTPAELDLLARATNLNEEAIRRTVSRWEKGWTRQDLNHAYAVSAVELGGFVRDPGALVVSHATGEDPTLTVQSGLEDEEILPGTHVMFDCHGTLDLYCWDGGKSWVVGGEPTREGAKRLSATAEVGAALVDAMRPGARISELCAKGREVYRKAGMPDADGAFIFFHGLGLSHMDFEVQLPDGEPYRDWVLEENMVLPIHLFYPGGERDRAWLEEVAVVGADGGRPLFSWGFEPLTGD
jgi:Xaa-Pro aminopeptidase